MKKLLLMILALCLAVLPAMAETASHDAVTSASVADSTRSLPSIRMARPISVSTSTAA